MSLHLNKLSDFDHFLFYPSIAVDRKCDFNYTRWFKD